MTKLRKPKSSKARLVFFGNERLATGVSTDAPTLRALVNAGYEIDAVIASHEDPISRQKRGLEIGTVAHAYHIPVLLTGKKIDLLTKIKKHPADAAILVAFGKIIPQPVIDLFPKGIINIHPSLLPKLRGTTPVETAILNGLAETGVSLMQLTAEMDAGPVYAQQKIGLSGSETKPELAARLLNEGVQLLLDNLDSILDGALKPKVQDETEATYTKLLTKQDGHLDFSLPAEAIERQVRAYIDFPRSRAKLFGREVIITIARLAQDLHDGNLVVKANPGYLEIVELVAPSGRTMSGAEFIRGYKK
jgi:methionyl-tRNA formyltransferase